MPKDRFTKVHVESWTNGWNLRDHYWASFRLSSLANNNPCIGVLLDKKQLQVYLMFQHYKSNQRQGNIKQYNQLLDEIPSWSRKLDLDGWRIWNGEMSSEFDDHLKLSDYLNDVQKQVEFKKN